MLTNLTILQLSLTGITYIPFTIILIYITFRFYRVYILTGNQIYRQLHYAFAAFSFVCATGALAGTIYVDSEEGIRWMLYISSVLLSLGNGVLAYIYIRQFKWKISPWVGLGFLTSYGFFVTVLTCMETVNPYVESSGGVNWGMPFYINALRVSVYFLGLIPMTVLFYRKFNRSSESNEKKGYLFLALLFSLFVVIVITDFILEPLLLIKAIYSEIAIFVGSIFGTAVYLTTYELVIVRIEKQYQKLIENLEDLVIIVDREGYIRYLNPSIQEKLKIDNNQDLRRISDLVHPDDIAVIEDNLQLAKTSQLSAVLEFRYMDSEQNPLWVETTGSFIPVKRFGYTQDAYLLASHDISARKIIEQKLIEAKVKAEESEKLKSAFINNIYHEIRTPLNGIMGLADLLVSEDAKKEEREEYLELLQSSGETLVKTIDSLIEIAEIESENINLDMMDCDYRNLIGSVVNNYVYHKKIVSGKVEIITEFPDKQLPDTIKTVPQRLYQILNHIVDNAIKFTAEGSVTIGVESHESREGMMKFYVKDTGIGISPRHLTHIFQPFYKVVKSGLKYYQGTGLGITISKKLAELLGGKITVLSEVDKGSTFFIWVPEGKE